MLKQAKNIYRTPAPAIYELLGDILLILTVIGDAFLIAYESDPKWIVINSIVGAAGKILLRLAKYKTDITSDDPSKTL